MTDLVVDPQPYMKCTQCGKDLSKFAHVCIDGKEIKDMCDSCNQTEDQCNCVECSSCGEATPPDNMAGRCCDGCCDKQEVNSIR